MISKNSQFQMFFAGTGEHFSLGGGLVEWGGGGERRFDPEFLQLYIFLCPEIFSFLFLDQI